MLAGILPAGPAAGGGAHKAPPSAPAAGGGAEGCKPPPADLHPARVWGRQAPPAPRALAATRRRPWGPGPLAGYPVAPQAPTPSNRQFC